MVIRVLILMSVMWVHILAIRMLHALMTLDHFRVPVTSDMKVYTSQPGDFLSNFLV